jgi:uncharacterized LabA/DUF88 family protein
VTTGIHALTGRRTRVFIDYWNFQLAWNERVGQQPGCDYKQLPLTIVTAANGQLTQVGLVGSLELEETLLYASVDPVGDADLRRWLADTVNRFPSYSVSVRERRSRQKSLRCRACNEVTSSCPACKEPYVGSVEKGVDTAIVTDLLTLAWQQAYDVAVLVTSDADLVPAVERIQGRGLKVINAGWRGKGNELKQACWAAFDLDTVAPALRRTQR